MRCSYCANLSIEALVDLAKEEFSGHTFPTTAFYQHHASFKDLADAALSGCDLCQLIADCFKGIRWRPRTMFYFADELWEGSSCDVEASAYAVAKELDGSDVKLAISTTQTYLSEPLDKVRVFNALLVQVGPSDWDNEDVEFPYLTLTLSTSPGYEISTLEDAVSFGQFRVGRYRADPNLGSAENFDIARSWLGDCRTHEGCFSKGARRLPTRVVDIGPLDQPIRPRVFLTNDAEADYIALSHCWGGSIPTILDSKTYERYQKDLPYDDLPANFQDALVIARELGIRYVWIDSLCIIQDSASDWAHESKQMAAIYRNATLTVSATVSERSTTGILKTYSLYESSAPKSVSLRVFRDQGRSSEIQVEWRPFAEENFRGIETDGALNGRGWTLQEFILSPSNLLFGSRQIYWRCLDGARSADGMPEGNEFPERTYRMASHVIFNGVSAPESDASLDASAVLEDYYQLASAYSSRRLTYGSDKLPAFSGIARSLRPALGGEYLAGLWTSDFTYGLLWYAELRSAMHVQEYRAPSWSWMVSDEPIIFLSPPRLPPTDKDLELLEHAVVLEDKTNPYGRVTSSHVVVRGLTAPLFRSEEVVGRDSSSPGSVCGHVSYDEPTTTDGPFLSFWLNLFSLGDSSPVFVSMAGKAEEGFEFDPDSIIEADLLLLLVKAAADVEEDMYGLVVRPIDQCQGQVYERAGFATFMKPMLEFTHLWSDRTIILI